MQVGPVQLIEVFRRALEVSFTSNLSESRSERERMEFPFGVAFPRMHVQRGPVVLACLRQIRAPRARSADRQKAATSFHLHWRCNAA